MKKLTACLLTIACLAALLTGCGQAAEKDPASAATEAPSAAPTATPEDLAYEKTKHSVRADGIFYYKTPEDYAFFVIKKSGLYGLIDQAGTMMMDLQNEPIHLSSGAFGGGSMTRLAVGEAYDSLDGSGSYEDKLTANGTVVQEPYITAGGDYAGECCLYGGMACYLKEDFDGNQYLITPEPLKDTGWAYSEWIPDWGSVFPLREVKNLANGVVEYTSEQYALYDLKAKKLLTEFVYDGFDNFGFCENALAVKKNGKWGYVSDTGKEIGAFCYDGMELEPINGSDDALFQCDCFQNGYVTVKKDGKYGLLDTTGEEVIPCTLAGLSGVNQEGYFWMSENGTDWSLCRMN